MLSVLYDLIFLFSACLLAVIATGVAYAVLKHQNVMDVPNARSNHAVPVPRGGGIGILVAVLLLGAMPKVLVAMVFLAIVSFIDDMRGLSARVRFSAQAIAVVGLLLTAYDGQVFGGFVPMWLELPLLALAWLWFINLFNFMDGSDGLAGGEAFSIAAGLLLLAVFVPLAGADYHMALVLLGASAGFLLWNWNPAKIFMGDVGSVPLGLLLGYLLLSVAGQGYWAAAAILPAVFVADASFTLLRRLLKGERIFEAHSSHCYQRAIRGGMSHAQVAQEVMEMNAVLAAIAALSTTGGWALQIGCVLAAYVAVFGLLWRLAAYKTATHETQADDPLISDAEIVAETPAKHI